LVKTPREKFLIGAAGEGASAQRFVVDLEEVAAAVVEPKAEVLLVIGRELARRIEADFVEHTSKIDELTDLVINTAKSGNVRHETISVGFSETGEAKNDSAATIINERGEEPEGEGGGVDPELVERHGPVVAGVDDRHVLDGDQHPADHDHTLDLRIADRRRADVDLLDESGLGGWVRAAGDELD